jgi:hypothetical protein
MAWPKGKKVPPAVLAKRNQAISKAMRERFLKQVESEEDAPRPTHKRCSGCGETLPVEKFHVRRTTLKSGVVSVTPQGRCKECLRKRQKAKYAAIKADPERYAEFRKRIDGSRDPEKKRNANREFETARRREEGIAPRNFSRPRPEDAQELIPVGPIRKLILEHLEADRSLRPKTLAERAAKIAGTTVDAAERRLNAVRWEEQDEIGFRWADAFLTSLHCQDQLVALFPVEPQAYTYIR